MLNDPTVVLFCLSFSHKKSMCILLHYHGTSLDMNFGKPDSEQLPSRNFLPIDQSQNKTDQDHQAIIIVTNPTLMFPTSSYFI